MEEELKIDLPDGKKLYGILRKSKEDKKLVIFVHGLTGHKNEHQFFNAAPVFAEEGYSSFRLDLYNYNEDARELLDCTVGTHSEDLNVALDYFKDGYESIYLVGHSIGGPTIIYADHDNVKAMALWDPSLEILENLEQYAAKVDGSENYLLKWGTNHLVSKEFIESLKSVNKTQVTHIDVPSVIVLAEKSELYARWRPHLKNITTDHETVVIEGASHGFDEPGAEEQLFEATLNWFNKLYNKLYN